MLATGETSFLDYSHIYSYYSCYYMFIINTVSIFHLFFYIMALLKIVNILISRQP